MSILHDTILLYVYLCLPFAGLCAICWVKERKW